MRSLLATLTSTLLMLTISCSESGFTGNGATRGAQKDKDKKDDQPADGDMTDARGGSEPEEETDIETNTGDEDLEVDGTGDEDKPEGLIEAEDGVKVIRADYTACLSLPSAGKQGYGKCADNAVVVIVNDGKSQEQTCCPLSGKNILSAEASERHVLRTGSCQADEILTGMQSATGNSGYCSKINTKYLKLSEAVPSQYVQGNAPGVLGQIAKSYNVNDTCICPEGTIALLGHTASDNKCAETCVRIVEKK